MTTEITTPIYKIRVVVSGSLIHTASLTEPIIHTNDEGRIERVDITPAEPGVFGDVLGWVDWTRVSAVTWRQA